MDVHPTKYKNKRLLGPEGKTNLHKLHDKINKLMFLHVLTMVVRDKKTNIIALEQNTNSAPLVFFVNKISVFKSISEKIPSFFIN